MNLKARLVGEMLTVEVAFGRGKKARQIEMKLPVIDLRDEDSQQMGQSWLKEFGETVARRVEWIVQQEISTKQKALVGSMGDGVLSLWTTWSQIPAPKPEMEMTLELSTKEAEDA